MVVPPWSGALDRDHVARCGHDAHLLAVEQHVEDRVGLDVVLVDEDVAHRAVLVVSLLSQDLGREDGDLQLVDGELHTAEKSKVVWQWLPFDAFPWGRRMETKSPRTINQTTAIPLSHTTIP